MSLVAYVLLVAAIVVVWGLLSWWFPRLGLLTNGVALTYVTQYAVLEVGFGRTVLALFAVGLGLFAAAGGLIAQRQRAADPGGLPRARLR